LSCSSGIQHGNRGTVSPQVLTVAVPTNIRSNPGPVQLPASAARKGCAVAAQPSGKTATEYPSYLRTAQVADLLYVSPKTVSRWAKEGKLPFLKTLGGHRRFPEAEIRELAEELRQEAIT
jgi:excisionase family DNA binding protein